MVDANTALSHLAKVIEEMAKQDDTIQAGAYTIERKRGEEICLVAELVINNQVFHSWNIEAEMTGSTRRRRATSKLCFSVEGYGWHDNCMVQKGMSFPQQKDGSFNYEEIARLILQHVYYNRRIEA